MKAYSAQKGFVSVKTRSKNVVKIHKLNMVRDQMKLMAAGSPIHCT